MDSTTTCGCSGGRLARWAATGGLLGSLGICAACCLGPLLLVAVGAGGAWATRLEHLAAYRWLLVAATVLLVGLGAYFAYFRRSRCAAGSGCTARKSAAGVRAMLWIAGLLAIAGLLFERIEQLLG